MGAPFTTGAASDKILKAKIDASAKAIQRLCYLHAHDALTLIRHCVSVPKLLHVLRFSPCANNEFLQFDDILRDDLSKVLNADLSHNQWIQATLPVNKDGIGIRNVVSLAPSAFLASAASTFNLQDRIFSENLALIPDTSVTEALAIWSELFNNQIVNESQKITQKAWDDKVTEIQFKKSLDNAILPEDKARLLAAKKPQSGAWLNTVPKTAISLRLSGEAIRLSIGLRLGSNLCEPYVCICAKFVNAKGLHSFSCKRSSGKIARHDFLNDIILRAMQCTKIPAKKNLWASEELMERDQMV